MVCLSFAVDPCGALSSSLIEGAYAESDRGGGGFSVTARF